MDVSIWQLPMRRWRVGTTPAAKSRRRMHTNAASLPAVRTDTSTDRIAVQSAVHAAAAIPTADPALHVLSLKLPWALQLSHRCLPTLVILRLVRPRTSR